MSLPVVIYLDSAKKRLVDLPSFGPFLSKLDVKFTRSDHVFFVDEIMMTVGRRLKQTRL